MRFFLYFGISGKNESGSAIGIVINSVLHERIEDA